MVPKDKAVKRFIVRFMDIYVASVCQRVYTLLSCAVQHDPISSIAECLFLLTSAFNHPSCFPSTQVRNIVDASALRDIQDSCPYEGYMLPKLYRKVYYSISAAIHSRVVRVRSRKNRRNREPPARPFFRGGQQTRPGGPGAPTTGQ